MREERKLRLVQGGKGTDGIAIGDENKAAYQPVTKHDRMAKDILVRAHGHHAAAWLLWKHRRQLSKLGAMDFDIPRKKGIPRWFWVAIEYLKAHRSETWLVREVIVHGKTRRFRIRWKHRGSWKRMVTEWRAEVSA